MVYFSVFIYFLHWRMEWTKRLEALQTRLYIILNGWIPGNSKCIHNIKDRYFLSHILFDFDVKFCGTMLRIYYYLYVFIFNATLQAGIYEFRNAMKI